MAGFVTLVQYAGTPIACWCPAEMPEVQCNYTMALCWVKQNKYYVHEDEDIVRQQDDLSDVQIAYYPWVPWILFSMAAIMKFPHYIWQSFAHSSGLNLVKLIELADSHEDVETLAKILKIWLVRSEIPCNSNFGKAKHFLGSVGFFWLGKRHKTYLTGLTIFIKFMYLLVAVGMHYGLNVFIDEDFIWYGIDVFENYLRGIPQFSTRFPAHTLCDMEIRHYSTVHRYSIQCILPVNRYSEKIFIFVWFWLLLLILVNAWSFFKWCIRLLSPAERLRFVRSYVEISLYMLEKQKEKTEKAKNLKNRNVFYWNGILQYNNAVNGNKLAVGKKDESQSSPQARPRKRIITTFNNFFTNGFRYRQNYCIEANEKEAEEFEKQEKMSALEERRERKVLRITKRMLKRLGLDGVVMFRTLEDAVGVCVANQIFQELYEELDSALHYS